MTIYFKEEGLEISQLGGSRGFYPCKIFKTIYENNFCFLYILAPQEFISISKRALS